MEDAYMTITSGDDEVLDLTVTDPANNNNPTDLTGADLWFYVKVRRSDPDADALVSKRLGAGITISNALLGRAEVAIADTDTASIPGGVYRWELQEKDINGDVNTLAKGWIRIEGDLVVATA